MGVIAFGSITSIKGGFEFESIPSSMPVFNLLISESSVGIFFKFSYKISPPYLF